MARPLFAALLLLLGVQACQYPVETSTLPELRKFLLIDAELTPHYGKVRVDYTLTQITSQGGYQFSTPPVAKAYVLDSQGNRSDFNPDGTADSLFHGVVGETYTLYVEADGQSYRSQPETIRACPDIDSLAPLYSRELSRDPGDLRYDGFDVYAYLRDRPGEEDFYQWDWVHYERLAYCEVGTENGGPVRFPCNPLDCWGITYNTDVIVQSDKLRDGNAIAHKITRVPFSRPPNKYYLRIQQRAITPSVFAYFQSLEIQTQNTGSLFDIPAQTKFNPNVFNVNKPAEQILGVFNVFDYRQQVLYINQLQQIPGAQVKVILDLVPFSSSPFASSPCIEGRYRTQKKPEGWQD